MRSIVRTRVDVVRLLEVLPEAFGVVTFVQVVDLRAKAGIELSHHADEVPSFGRAKAATGDGRQPVQQLQVLVDLFHGAWSADLDHDLGAVCQGRQMRLSDRTGGKWLLIEGGKALCDRLTQLGLYRFEHGCGGYLGRLVLQKGKLRLEGEGNQVGAGGQHLPQLHERRSELLERHSQLVRSYGRRSLAFGSLVPERHQVLQGHELDQVPEVVVRQNGGDLPRSAKR
jgi:hypothetical protein